MRHFRSLALSLGLLSILACGGNTGGGDDDDGPTDVDTDGDTINDGDEGSASGTDTDSDGTPDYLDDDSDGDGIPDYREAGDGDPATPPPDHDGDGVPDFRDTDSDDNGRLDGEDGLDDRDGDGLADFVDRDDDGDEMMDSYEIGDDVANPIDTDGDDIPDFQDTDSDDDTILDLHDRQYDPDEDGIPAFRDTDSDDDCRPDAVEAGDAILTTAPVDSDGDTGGDFIDLDSDNDGLLDELEDLNCNGAADAGESSAADEDTDGDGVSDLVEVAAGTDPSNDQDNPQANGDFVFVVPYVEPPTPEDDTLDFATNISQADVYFSMDTTGSMGGEISALKTSLGTVINDLNAEIPNIAVGVGYYEDFPMDPYGRADLGDLPFGLIRRIMTVSTTAGRNSMQAGVDALAAAPGSGGDEPESGWEAMYQIATGVGLSNIGGATVAAFNTNTAPPVPVPAGESVGTIGGVGFRTGSLPIVVAVTDMPSHNGLSDAYAFSGSATRSTAINALIGIQARVIGVVSQGGYTADARSDMLTAVSATGASVPVSAWDGARPAGCGATQCCTGVNGAGEPATGGMCPLLFTVNSSGAGLGSSIVTAIRALTNFAVIDVGANIGDDTGDAVDAVAAFVDHIAANPAAPLPCGQGLTAVDGADADSFLDTFVDVYPGTTACFDVFPKMNTTVQPLQTPQMFTATITVYGDNVTELDTRRVYFLVPPEIPDVPVD